MTSPPERNQLFISYSHVDREWVERLQKMIKPLVRSEALRLWDDSKIPPGAKWKAEIEKALASAKVALLLVSDDFLASEFVINKELPPLLRAAEHEGLCILWVCLGPCFYEATPIHDYQAVLPPDEPLEALSPVQQKAALKSIAEAIRDALSSEVAAAPVPPAQVQPRPVPATDSLRLQRFATITGLLRQEGGCWSLVRRPLQVEGYREDLGGRLALTLIEIPAGSFLMGSPPEEPGRSDDEGPQHEVKLASFFMSHTPITQAQWREVAGWQPLPAERWGQDLNPDPSHFYNREGQAEGEVRLFEAEANTDNRPVENVSWLDAMEFCNRLSQRTGRTYSLPSEAQWEYACRAGTTTPFHFGDTISPELANYRGDVAYADGPQGVYREQTTPVAMFPANAWGLHDMHANVWEWCLDEWHDSYEGAPTDGRAWVDAAEGEKSKESVKTKLLRGGSWYSDPRFCRSACRDRNLPDDAGSYVGFRVVCLPQDPSLNP